MAIEARVTQPMLPLGLFRNPSFTGAQVGAFGISGSLFALWLYLTLYLQQVLGLSAIEAGLVFVPGTLLNFAVAGATASLAQKVSARALVAGGLALIAAGLALLTVVGVGHVVVAVPPRPAGGDGRHGDAQPRRRAGRAELGAAGAERARRRRQRHVPPGRLAIGVAGLGALISTAGPQAYVDGLHDALWVGAALAAACAVATGLLIQSPARPSRSVKLAAESGELTREVVGGDLDHVGADGLEERVAERAVVGGGAVEVADALVEALGVDQPARPARSRARPRSSP